MTILILWTPFVNTASINVQKLLTIDESFVKSVTVSYTVGCGHRECVLTVVHQR